MKNASGHQGENEWQLKKCDQEHVRHFLLKTCYWGVSGSFTLWPYKTTAKKCRKKVYCTCKVAFLLIRPIVVFHRSRCLSRSALRDFIFCLGKLYRVSQKFVPLISCTTTFDQNFIFTRNF